MIYYLQRENISTMLNWGRARRTIHTKDTHRPNFLVEASLRPLWRRTRGWVVAAAVCSLLPQNVGRRSRMTLISLLFQGRRSPQKKPWGFSRITKWSKILENETFLVILWNAVVSALVEYYQPSCRLFSLGSHQEKLWACHMLADRWIFGLWKRGSQLCSAE